MAEDVQRLRDFVVKISYKVQNEAGKEELEAMVVPSFMAEWMAAELVKQRGVKPYSIQVGKQLPVRIDQYNAAVKLREQTQHLDLAALKVAQVFALSNEQDTLHPETCLAIIETAKRGVAELREWVDAPLTYMVGKGITIAIPFPPRKS
jgi:hypothetical protein